MILFSDWLKSVVVAAITTEVERVNKEVKDLESMRTKVEQYDLKNSELIQRSGYESVIFTERKWIDLTEQIQDKKARTSLMTRSKNFYSGLQRHVVMMALVDCALAKLIAVGKIFAVDIFVYARAIEDMINFVLMKSRAESELASMESSIKVLRELKDIWDASEERNLLDCAVQDMSNELSIKGLTYTRGSASVNIENMTLKPGVFALTGANGSGKSTLFRLLMGCRSNYESVDLHSSIVLNSRGSLSMPSSDVVEITQNFYFPLFSTPFDWIYNVDIFEGVADESMKESMTKKLEAELKSLKFYPETQLESSESTLMADLTSEKEDWFSDLSGGQKSKVELVRKIFLADQCPGVLLIDETFAPLDPESKNLCMQKIKEFCKESIVIVIYHADVKMAEGEEASAEDLGACVESSNFFDSNIHVEDGALSLRPVCS
jgi:ABC-type bacteriocin/lantibiotic exporter with double-glycine peptidase domain